MKWLKTRYSLFMTTVYHGPMQQTEMYIWFWKSRWSNSDAQHFHSYWYWNFCCCCCRQQRLVCMCVRRLMKTEKENTQIHTNFFFYLKAVKMCAKSLLDAFNCVYTMINTIHTTTYESVFHSLLNVMLAFWHIFSVLSFVCALSYSAFLLSFSLLGKSNDSQTVTKHLPQWKQSDMRLDALLCVNVR